MHFVFGGDYSYKRVLERIKYFIYCEDFDLYEKMGLVAHIASYEKYTVLNNGVFKVDKSGDTMREIRKIIANYMANQYEEAHNFIDDYSEKYTPRSFIEEVKKRLNAFLTSEPYGYMKREHKSEDLTSAASKFLRMYNVDDIYKTLTGRVYRQDEAKRTISVMLHNHMSRIAYPNVEQEKRNYLMVGPTGLGKTEIIRTLKYIAPVPIVVVDGGNLTGAG